MLRITCAWALSLLCLSAKFCVGADDPRALYESAATQVAERDYQAAVGSLSKLIDDYPDSVAAKFGRRHLAECYLAIGQGRNALATLLEVQPDQVISIIRDQGLESELPETVRELALKAIERIIFRFEEEEKYPEAIELQRCMGRIQPSPKHRQAILRIAIRGSVMLARQDESYQVLVAAVPQELRHHFLLGLAEAFRNAGDAQRAESNLRLLISELTTVQADSSDDRTATKQLNSELLPTAYLRLVAILTKDKKTWEALQLARESTAKFANFEHAVEFDFLTAQNLISGIQFDEAQQTLQAVMSNTGNGPNTRARAQWLVGELYFLQDRWQEASLAYSATEKYGALAWSHRAQLQRAKCLELLHEPQLARSLYEALSQIEDGDISGQAQARLALLSSPPLNAATK